LHIKRASLDLGQGRFRFSTARRGRLGARDGQL
jgi:hypothetical protein